MKNILSFAVVFLITLVITSSIAALIAGGVFLLTNSFLPYFLLSFGCILIIGSISNKIKEFKTNKFDILERIKIEHLQKGQSAVLNCAFCNKDNIALIDLSKKNTFKCIHCNNVNSIILHFNCVRLTTPIIKSEKLMEIDLEHEQQY